MVSDASSAGGYVAQAAAEDQMVSDASSAGGYVAQAAAEDQMVSDASSAGGDVAQAAGEGQMVRDASSAGGFAGPPPRGRAPLLVLHLSRRGGAALRPAPRPPVRVVARPRR